MNQPNIVSQAEWLEARKALLAKEKELTRFRDQLATGRAFYNYEYGDPGLEDLSGDSVFVRDDAGQIFHTTYSRGGEEFLGVYQYLDATPRAGRGRALQHARDWVRPEHVRQGRPGRGQWALPSAELRLRRASRAGA